MKRIIVFVVLIFVVFSIAAQEFRIGPVFSLTRLSENDGTNSGSYYNFSLGLNLSILYESGFELVPEVGVMLYNEDDPDDLVSTGTDFSSISTVLELGGNWIFFNNDILSIKGGISGGAILYGKPSGGTVVSYDSYSSYKILLGTPIALDIKVNDSIHICVSQNVLQFNLQNTKYEYSGINVEYSNFYFNTISSFSPVFSFNWLL